MADSLDEDLRDVFRMLYSEDDWDWDEQELDEKDAPSTNLGDVEVEVIDHDLDVEYQYKSRHTRKRLFSQLESLLTGHPSKKPRIYIPVSTQLPITPKQYLSTDTFPVLPSPSQYSPYTPLALLARLRTYQPSTYPSSLTHQLSPLNLANQGWTNSGKDTLVCGYCKATWSIGGIDEIRDEGIRKEVEKRLGAGAVERHGVGCAWKVRRCPDGLVTQLRGLLHPLLSSSLGPLAESLENRLDTKDLKWISPIGEKQSQALSTRLTDYLRSSTNTMISSPSESPSPVSALSGALSLFAWYPYPPSASTSAPTEIIHCRICERRIGLWAFRGDGDRELDLLNEHLGWCPIRGVEGDGVWWSDNELVKGSHEAIRAEKVKGLIKVSQALEKRAWTRFKGRE